MSENERKCFILGLSVIRLPFFCLPVPAFEQWGGFLFWVMSSGKNPKARLPPWHPPLTSHLPCVSTRSQARKGGCSSQELEDAERSLDVSCWVGPAPGTYGPGKTGMSSHLCVAQLAELNMGHKGELPVAKDAPKCPHHDWAPGLTLLASLVLISWSCLCKNTRGAEGSIKKRFPCVLVSWGGHTLDGGRSWSGWPDGDAFPWLSPKSS